MLNQQDLAKNGWGHLKSGWGLVDSACAHAWHRSCKKTLSLEAAFLPVIDDLPAFVLPISMVRSPLILLLPSSLSPPVPFLSYCPPPSGPLFLSTLQFSPFSPFPHSYAFVTFPKSPRARSSHPLPPCFKFILHGFISKLQHIFWRPELDTVAYIYRVKQTIVHMILSRSVHQINIVANYPGLTGRLPVFLASRQFTQLL